MPEGFKAKDLVLTDESLDRAVVRTLSELFAQGMFENPYRDPKVAIKETSRREDWKEAELVHRKSVVLLKNQDILPLTQEKIVSKKIYAEAFGKNRKAGIEATKALREMLKGYELTEESEEADYAILMVSPSSGNYFNATMGYLELDICENKAVCNVDKNGRPAVGTHQETTLVGAKRIAEIADNIHANGGKVIANVNITLAWEIGNIERYADAFLVGFDTYPRATLDVIFGRFVPTGKLPLTLPKDDSVLAVNAEGNCISPNDVPGYDKDRYMPDSSAYEKRYGYFLVSISLFNVNCRMYLSQ